MVSNRAVSNRAKTSNRNPPSALKHGAFSKTAILPGEDPGEFEALHFALIDEWIPDGATEDDAVLTIARCLWRKRRVQNFLHAKIAARAIDPNHSGFDIELTRIAYATMMESAPDVADRALSQLTGPLRSHFEKKYPPDNYETRLEWAAEVRKDIISSLDAELDRPQPTLAPDLRMMKSADVLGEDLFKNELVAEERLDAMIDRAIKRLVQTKALKQMLASSLDHEDHQPRRIRFNKPTGSASRARDH